LTASTATLASLNFVGATGTDAFAAGAIVSETFDNATQTTIPATDIFITAPASSCSNPVQGNLQFRQELRVSEVAELNRKGGATGNVNLPAYNALNTANLDLLPATGSVIVCPPLKIEGGSGSPLRVLALVPKLS